MKEIIYVILLLLVCISTCLWIGETVVGFTPFEFRVRYPMASLYMLLIMIIVGIGLYYIKK